MVIAVKPERRQHALSQLRGCGTRSQVHRRHKLLHHRHRAGGLLARQGQVLLLLHDYCSFTKHDITFDTTYQPPSAVDGEPTAADVLSLLADDALAIIDNNYSIDDFADEYGYTKPSQAIRAYEGHTKTLDWMKDTLEFDEDDVRQFTTVLHEDLAGVKAGVATIVSERQAEHERTHPKVPEGFVTIESLQEDLDLGDYGDRCTEFWNRYVNERFDDVADDLVDLSYHDLLKWLPDNYEWVEQAAENGRFYGSETDFFRMIQTAQRECFTQDMYVHQEDIVKYVTLESLKDAGVYAVSQELADALDTDVDYADANRFDAALDEAKEQVASVMAANLEGALGDEDLAQEAAEELVGDDDYGIVNPAALSVEAVRAVNEKGYDAAFAECDFWKEYTERGEADRGTDTPSLAETAKECRDSSTELAQAGQSHEQERDAGNVER